MLASIAALHGVLNYPDSGPTANRFPTSPDRLPESHEVMRRMDAQHRDHVTARYPNDPRVRLAAVLAHPEARRQSNRPATTATFVTEGYPGEVQSRWRAQPGPGVSYEREQDNAKWVGKVIDQLTALVDAPDIGAEVRVRRGILFFHRADLTGALRDLRQAATDADDPVVRYMAHFYAGLTLDNLNQRSAAIDEFSAAVTLIPNARSGALALASDLFLLDRHDEAASIVEATLTAPASNDPWRTFTLGDYRFWPGYLARLREAVRR
jgi:tetratricopeptide (TPR) repeat protein